MESDSDYLTDGDEIDEGNVEESAPPSQRNTGFGERHLLDLKQSLGRFFLGFSNSRPEPVPKIFCTLQNKYIVSNNNC